MPLPARSRRLARVLPIALVVAAALPAGPAVAQPPTPKTWYVAPSGTGGGSCATPDRNSIQAAVDDSGQGDTILVCPGTYEGQVLISGSVHDGLTVRSTEKLGATIATGTGSGGYGQLVGILIASDVTLQDFRLLATTTPGCRFASRHIEIGQGAARARIIGNSMSTQGDVTLQGSCTVGQGVLVNTGASATIQGNTIRDFVADGIAVGNADVTIQGNTIRFWHKGWQRGSQIDAGTGITVQKATVRIRGNTIVGLASAGLKATATPILEVGILIENIGQAALVRGNRVARAVHGIEIVGGAGMVIRNNDARGNARLDCRDGTRGKGTRGTANTWLKNLGKPSKSRPKGLCQLP